MSEDKMYKKYQIRNKIVCAQANFLSRFQYYLLFLWENIPSVEKSHANIQSSVTLDWINIFSYCKKILNYHFFIFHLCNNLHAIKFIFYSENVKEVAVTQKSFIFQIREFQDNTRGRGKQYFFRVYLQI